MTETVYNLIKTKSSIIFLSVDQFTVNLSSIQATLSVNLFHKTNWLLHNFITFISIFICQE